MKPLILMALVLLTLQTATADTVKKRKKGPSAKTQVTLGTSFRFDGSSLHGKYQTSPATTATVENDKFLEDILGARKNFDDRVANDLERQ
jgi:hypothetical protein